MEDDSSSGTHDLLLALAGRVDDDLLAMARELVAVGEDGHAVELVTASLIADRAALPPPLRTMLVDAARSARTGLDPATALPPGESEVDTEHRFDPGPHGDPVSAALLALPARQLRGCTVLLTRRTTPAGSAPGPLPHPVVLVEVQEGARPKDVLAYQLAVALQRAGVHASVEVLTAGMQVPDYHVEARRGARSIRSDGDSGSFDISATSTPAPAQQHPDAGVRRRRPADPPPAADTLLFGAEQPPFDRPSWTADAPAAQADGPRFRSAESLFERPPDRQASPSAAPSEPRQAEPSPGRGRTGAPPNPYPLPRRTTAPLAAVRSVFDEAPPDQDRTDGPHGSSAPTNDVQDDGRSEDRRVAGPRGGDVRRGRPEPSPTPRGANPARRGEGAPRPVPRPGPRPVPGTRPSVTPISRSTGPPPTPLPQRAGPSRLQRPFTPADGETGDVRGAAAGPASPEPEPDQPLGFATHPSFDPLNDPLDGRQGRPLLPRAGSGDEERQQGPGRQPDRSSPSRGEDSWSGEWLSGAWAMPASAVDDHPGEDARGERAAREPQPAVERDREPPAAQPGQRVSRHRYLQEPSDGTEVPPRVVDMAPASEPSSAPPTRRRAIPMPSGRAEPDPEQPPREPAGQAGLDPSPTDPSGLDPSRLGLRPESLARFTDDDRQLLARLQAELLDGGKPRMSRTAGIGGTTNTSDGRPPNGAGDGETNGRNGGKPDRANPPDLAG